MYIWLTFALVFAFLQAIAVSGNLQPLEYIAKPAVMVFLFLWLYAGSGLQGNTLWFGLGIVFSLVGDTLLMVSSDRTFLFGLVAFLFAHLFYITGFREELTTFNTWSLILLTLIAMSVGVLIRRIVRAMRANGKNRLVGPVILYGTVISVMLYAAVSTITDPAWKTSAAFFVGIGALLFCTSDAILAWNKFVFPIRNGRVWNIVLYHLGQIGLIAGAISQFA